VVSAIEKARRLVADPGAYTMATSHGAAQYVKNLAFDKETGEVVVERKLEIVKASNTWISADMLRYDDGRLIGGGIGGRHG